MMKKNFLGYRRKSDEEIKTLWKEGLICFDANILLNMYRYSQSTRLAVTDLIKKFENNIWLPHQAALEYNRNRYEEIAAQEKTYKDFINKITHIESAIQSKNKPPFLSEKVHKKLRNVFDDVKLEVEHSINKYSSFLRDDEIYETFCELFNNKSCLPFKEEELNKIYEEGKIRYEKKIPPGYEDHKKGGVRKYGDLVMWKQIIAKAKETKKSIILITDERKEDWWWKLKDDRNMGPRQELIDEMMQEAEVNFHMYSSERFLSYGLGFHEEQINKKALEEIQEIKKLEMEEIRQIKRLKRLRRKNEKENLKPSPSERLRTLENRHDQFKSKIRTLKNIIFQLEVESKENPEALYPLEKYNNELREFVEEKNYLKAKINNIIIADEQQRIDDFFMNKKYYNKDDKDQI